jgi:hypothetical protein
MAVSDECVHLPHSKDTDGKYRVFREPVLATMDTQDLLKLAERKNAVMLGPLPRDLHTRCCGDTEHVRDQQTAGQRVAMRDAVAKPRVDLKDFL